MNLAALFPDLRLAAVARFKYPETDTPDGATLHLESMTNPDVIGIQVVIPWDRLTVYGIDKDGEVK